MRGWRAAWPPAGACRIPLDRRRAAPWVPQYGNGAEFFRLTLRLGYSMIGRSNRVYEILSRKRPLTLKMIWELHRKLGIPAESLVRPSKKARAA